MNYIKTNKDMTQRLRAIGMTNKEFANVIGYSVHAFKKWQNDVPQWVTFVIQYLELLKRDEEIAISLGISCRSDISKNRGDLKNVK